MDFLDRSALRLLGGFFYTAFMELARLQRSKTDAKNLIGEQIKRGRQIRPVDMGYEVAEARYQKWDKETYEVILEVFDTDGYATEYQTITEGFVEPDPRFRGWDKIFLARVDAKIKLLEEFKRRIDAHLAEPFAIQNEQPSDFWELIHPEIVAVTKTRFETGHYADCAESAFKQINFCVKEIVKRNTGRELDGADLMRQAFSPNKPIITIETLATESGKNVQQGFMDIFAGSMTGIRNPKAHAVIDIGKERAIHFIFLASLLMDTIDIANNKYRY
jgi:uncharacterized protein (TIGR02391 family)